MTKSYARGGREAFLAIQQTYIAEHLGHVNTIGGFARLILTAEEESLKCVNLSMANFRDPIANQVRARLAYGSGLSTASGSRAEVSDLPAAVPGQVIHSGPPNVEYSEITVLEQQAGTQFLPIVTPQQATQTTGPRLEQIETYSNQLIPQTAVISDPTLPPDVKGGPILRFLPGTEIVWKKSKQDEARKEFVENCEDLAEKLEDPQADELDPEETADTLRGAGQSSDDASASVPNEFKTILSSISGLEFNDFSIMLGEALGWLGGQAANMVMELAPIFAQAKKIWRAIKNWAKTFKAWWRAYKIKKAAKQVRPGTPTRGVRGVKKAFQRDRNFHARAATIDSADAAVSIVTVVGVSGPIASAAHLVNFLHSLAKDYFDKRNGNKLLREGINRPACFYDAMDAAPIVAATVVDHYTVGQMKRPGGDVAKVTMLKTRAASVMEDSRLRLVGGNMPRLSSTSATASTMAPGSLGRRV